MIWIGIGAAVMIGVLAGPIASNVEQAKYSVVKSDGNIEIRDYPALVIAQFEAAGPREEAINTGFKALAGYIFGDNKAQTELAMTAPVTQQANEEIAMTAPVTQQANGDKWQVRFVMPSRYTLETLSRPNNPDVKLKSTPPKRYVAIRFSGMASKDTLESKFMQLREYLQKEGIGYTGDPIYSFFNPPWTLSFLRRNEIMLELKQG